MQRLILLKASSIRKLVQIRGHTRKDGTVVKPHTANRSVSSGASAVDIDKEWRGKKEVAHNGMTFRRGADGVHSVHDSAGKELAQFYVDDEHPREPWAVHLSGKKGEALFDTLAEVSDHVKEHTKDRVQDIERPTTIKTGRRPSIPPTPRHPGAANRTKKAERGEHTVYHNHDNGLTEIHHRGQIIAHGEPDPGATEYSDPDRIMVDHEDFNGPKIFNGHDAIAEHFDKKRLK